MFADCHATSYSISLQSYFSQYKLLSTFMIFYDHCLFQLLKNHHFLIFLSSQTFFKNGRFFNDLTFILILLYKIRSQFSQPDWIYLSRPHVARPARKVCRWRRGLSLMASRPSTSPRPSCFSKRSRSSSSHATRPTTCSSEASFTPWATSPRLFSGK